MDKEIEVFEGLVNAMLKAKDIIDNQSQVEIEILKNKCEAERKSIRSAYTALEKFFTEHWKELQGNRMDGGIWKNNYLCDSPMYLGSYIHLGIKDEHNSVKVVSVSLDCEGSYQLQKRNNIVRTPSHPFASPHSVNTIDYWNDEWEALKWDRLRLGELLSRIKKELARLVNNQFERNNRAKEAINENVERVEIVISF